jgi:hypothetical protein
MGQNNFRQFIDHEVTMHCFTTGHSIDDGHTQLTGHPVLDRAPAGPGGPLDMGDCHVGWPVYNGGNPLKGVFLQLSRDAISTKPAKTVNPFNFLPVGVPFSEAALDIGNNLLPFCSIIFYA